MEREHRGVQVGGGDHETDGKTLRLLCNAFTCGLRAKPTINFGGTKLVTQASAPSSHFSNEA